MHRAIASRLAWDVVEAVLPKCVNIPYVEHLGGEVQTISRNDTH